MYVKQALTLSSEFSVNYRLAIAGSACEYQPIWGSTRLYVGKGFCPCKIQVNICTILATPSSG